jgi:ribokinase
MAAPPPAAVVGHLEWVDFLISSELPRAGEIVSVRAAHEAAAGGGAMAARAMRALTGACAFFVAVGGDERGARAVAELRAIGLEVHAAVRDVPQARAITWLTDDGERTIARAGGRLVPAGDDPLPWGRLAGAGGVYVTGGDGAAVRQARTARALVATPRARTGLLQAGVAVDVLVASGSDAGEAVDDELRAACRPRWVVLTEGARGGRWEGADGTRGRWSAAQLPGPVVDAYGCGDSFAAALTCALGAGADIDAACALAARVGATVLTQRAPSVGELAALMS